MRTGAQAGRNAPAELERGREGNEHVGNPVHSAAARARGHSGGAGHLRRPPAGGGHHRALRPLQPHHGSGHPRPHPGGRDHRPHGRAANARVEVLLERQDEGQRHHRDGRVGSVPSGPGRRTEPHRVRRLPQLLHAEQPGRSDGLLHLRSPATPWTRCSTTRT